MDSSFVRVCLGSWLVEQLVGCLLGWADGLVACCLVVSWFGSCIVGWLDG